MALHDLLDDPDLAAAAPLVHWRGTVLTRGEIAAAADRVADTLRRMGTAPDSVVAARVPSTPLGVVVCLGIWRVGAAAALLDPAAGPEAFAALVDDLRPAAVVRPSLDEASLVPQVSVHPGVPRHYADDVALVVTAPGPSGAPRRVQWSSAGVAAGLAAAADTLRARTGGVLALPLASVAGIDAALTSLTAGGGVDLLDPFVPAELAEAVRRHRAEAVTLTPPMVDALVDDPSVGTVEPLRYIRCVDGVVSDDDVRRVRSRFGVTVLAAYGRPEYGGEVTGWTSLDAATDGDVKPGAAGRPYPGVELRIRGADGGEAAPGESGEIWVRTPFAMRGYAADRIEPGTRVDAEGFVHMGDRGRVDRDGFLWIDALSD